MVLPNFFKLDAFGICAQRFALAAGGRAWTLLESRENSKPEKRSKTAQSPTSRLHALLARFWLARLTAWKKILPPNCWNYCTNLWLWQQCLDRLDNRQKTDLQMFRQAQQPTLAIQRTFTEQNLWPKNTLALETWHNQKARLPLETDLTRADKLTWNFAKRNRADFGSLAKQTTSQAEAKKVSQSETTKRQPDESPNPTMQRRTLWLYNRDNEQWQIWATTKIENQTQLWKRRKQLARDRR